MRVGPSMLYQSRPARRRAGDGGLRDTGSMSLLKWLGLDASAAGPQVDSVGEIERVLDGLEPAQARYLACFAYILSRVARADHAVDEDETRLMEQILADRGGLPQAQAALVVRIATTEGLRHGGTEDFLVTREFAGLADRDQKLASSTASLPCRPPTSRFGRSRTTRSGRLPASCAWSMPISLPRAPPTAPTCRS